MKKKEKTLLSKHIWIVASTGYGMTSPIIKVDSEINTKVRKRFIKFQRRMGKTETAFLIDFLSKLRGKIKRGVFKW